MDFRQHLTTAIIPHNSELEHMGAPKGDNNEDVVEKDRRSEKETSSEKQPRGLSDEIVNGETRDVAVDPAKRN